MRGKSEQEEEEGEGNQEKDAGHCVKRRLLSFGPKDDRRPRSLVSLTASQPGIRRLSDKHFAPKTQRRMSGPSFRGPWRLGLELPSPSSRLRVL